MDMIIPTILVCVLFGPAIPTSSFNFVFILISVLVFIALCNLSMPSYMVAHLTLNFLSMVQVEDGRYRSLRAHAKFVAWPCPSLTCVPMAS